MYLNTVFKYKVFKYYPALITNRVMAAAARLMDHQPVLTLKGGLHGATWCVYTHHVYTETRNEARMSPSQGSQLRFTEMSS